MANINRWPVSSCIDSLGVINRGIMRHTAKPASISRRQPRDRRCTKLFQRYGAIRCHRLLRASFTDRDTAASNLGSLSERYVDSEGIGHRIGSGSMRSGRSRSVFNPSVGCSERPGRFQLHGYHSVRWWVHDRGFGTTHLPINWRGERSPLSTRGIR